MNAAAKVLAWVAENFTDDVTVTPWPLLPGGVLIKDLSGAEMYVYWDMLTDQVKYTYPD